MNGYSGSTAGYTTSTVFGYCGTIENDQWLGFVAGKTSAVFTLKPSNCVNGDGVQIALYETCSGNAIECNVGNPGFGDTPVSINVSNMIPGKSYYVLVDGYAGDICDFGLTINPPTATMPAGPPGTPGTLSGPATVCPGQQAVYSIPQTANTGYYSWSVPAGAQVNGASASTNVDAPGGHQVTVTWGNTAGQVCVTPNNICIAGQSACTTVAMTSVPVTDLPPVTICAEDTPYQLPWGSFIGASGLYQTTIYTPNSCDSIVRQQVTVKAPIVTNLGSRLLCEGECFEVCDSMFCSPGHLKMTCVAAGGCDSLVQFTLVPFAGGSIQAPDGKTITCAMPELELIGSPLLNASWTNGFGQTVGNTSSIMVDTPGIYTYAASQSLGGVTCSDQKTVLIKKNTQTPEVTASGGVLDAAHPTVQLMGHSIISPVQYHWSGPNNFSSQLPNPIVGLPGQYTLTVLNTGNGCSSSITVEVVQQ